MKVLTNEKVIKRNARIGQYTSLIALLILAGGMVISFTMQTQIYLSFAALMIGFILSQIGIYFGNRWGRSPRIDERLNAALKGLTKEYTLYHFITPVSHLLVGPAGVWIIAPYYQRGKIVYEKNRWKQKGGGLLLGYLKIFAQEGLGRPDIEIQADMDTLSESLKKSIGDDLPPLNASLVFTDNRAELEAEGAPLPTLKLEQLKDFLRKVAKEKPFPAAQMKKITDSLPQESIV